MSKYEIKSPECYMSFSSGKYRVIVQGQPICNDKETLVEAAAAAKQCNVLFASIAWDGDNGRWVRTSTLGQDDPDVIVPCETGRYCVPSEEIDAIRRAPAMLREQTTAAYAYFTLREWKIIVEALNARRETSRTHNLRINGDLVKFSEVHDILTKCPSAAL